MAVPTVTAHHHCYCARQGASAVCSGDKLALRASHMTVGPTTKPLLGHSLPMTLPEGVMHILAATATAVGASIAFSVSQD